MGRRNPPTATKKKAMNKRLAITAQKAIGKGKLLWLDCYNDAIYDTVSPTLKTTTKSSERTSLWNKAKSTKHKSHKSKILNSQFSILNFQRC